MIKLKKLHLNVENKKYILKSQNFKEKFYFLISHIHYSNELHVSCRPQVEHLKYGKKISAFDI